MYCCPLCGSAMSLTNDGIWFVCQECSYDEETMALEEEETYIS